MESILVYRLRGAAPLGHVQDDPEPATAAQPLLWSTEGAWVTAADLGEPLCVHLEGAVPIPALLTAARDGSGYEVAVWRESTGLTDLEGGTWPLDPPVLTALEPAAATIGGEDFTLLAHGTGIVPGAYLSFNGGREASSIAALSTVFSMASATTPGEYEVRVHNPDGQVSAPLTFTLSAPGRRRSSS